MERIVVSIYNHIRIYKVDRDQNLYKPGHGTKHQDRFLMVGKAPVVDGKKAATYL